MKNQLLIPYGLRDGKLVHISEVERGKECDCICPVCMQPLIARKGDRKQHHFGHKSDTNCCLETVLHQSAKIILFERISEAISLGEPLLMKWKCLLCNDEHEGNLLKRSTSVKTEISMGVCRPDITLFDSNNILATLIEIVVTHAPEENVLGYAREYHIPVVQFQIETAEQIEELKTAKLLSPSYVDVCTRRKCKKCGDPKSESRLYVFEAPCWRCGRPMKIALVEGGWSGFDGPESFSKNQIKIAEKCGVILKVNYSKTANQQYISNTCQHCRAFVGRHFLDDYCDLLKPENCCDKEYICGRCEEKFRTLMR